MLVLFAPQSAVSAMSADRMNEEVCHAGGHVVLYCAEKVVD